MLYDGLAIAESKGFDKNDPRVLPATLRARQSQGLPVRSRPTTPSIGGSHAFASRARKIHPSARRATTASPCGKCARCAPARRCFASSTDADLLGTLRAETSSWAHRRARPRSASRSRADARPRSNTRRASRPGSSPICRTSSARETTPHAGASPSCSTCCAQQTRRASHDGPLGLLERHYPTIRKELMRALCATQQAWPGRHQTCVCTR